jgi:hypothetical protein
MEIPTYRHKGDLAAIHKNIEYWVNVKKELQWNPVAYNSGTMEALNLAVDRQIDFYRAAYKMARNKKLHLED